MSSSFSVITLCSSCPADRFAPVKNFVHICVSICIPVLNLGYLCNHMTIPRWRRDFRTWVFLIMVLCVSIFNYIKLKGGNFVHLSISYGL